MKNAAKILRGARAQSGMSQRALAARAGVKQPVISRIESGRQQPSLVTLERLVNACGYRLVVQLESLPDAHDRGLMETSLSLTPKQRIERLVAMERTAQKLRIAMRLVRERGA